LATGFWRIICNYFAPPARDAFITTITINTAGVQTTASTTIAPYRYQTGLRPQRKWISIQRGQIDPYRLCKA